MKSESLVEEFALIANQHAEYAQDVLYAEALVPTGRLHVGLQHRPGR